MDKGLPDGSESAKRILVADDNRDWADALALLLRAEGHTVLTSYDGREALDAAREFLPQIVVLDIRMPHMTGFEAARAFSKLSEGSATGADCDERLAGRSREAARHDGRIRPLFRQAGDARRTSWSW